ncbi:MAG: UbiD family decarboxylase [Candidatus Micrarchaeota archaeon]|nr:UbiD family decarboxylase [Candidatus Micrarchaeota archaeon]
MRGAPLSFRDFLAKLKKEGRLVRLRKPVSLKLELAGVLHELDGKPVYAESIKEAPGARVAGNVFSTKELVADYLGVEKEKLIPALVRAINTPSKPLQVKPDDAPVMEVQKQADLLSLPIPFHAPKDGGAYLSSAVVIAKDRELGQNCSFHRMMVLDSKRAVARILQRHLDAFINRAGGELDVAVVVGAPINFLLAAACSVELGVDEMQIANSLAPLRAVRLPNGILVPADAEFAFEARITRKMHDEGPFVDLTETYDVVRSQRVVEFGRAYHRRKPIWHALLPGGLEHKILMGMPREPTIYNEVSKVAHCTGVNITPGGCCWLHAVVSIRKKREDDGRKAIEAAFAGHRSLKHVVVVDEDIDIYDPASVEWAIATRVQADRDVVILANQKGSSLDPSADPHTCATAKMGIDATKPLVAGGKDFTKAEWKRVDVRKYL